MTLAFGTTMAQFPTNNPYKTTYAITNNHWTDSLKWSTVISVADFGAVANDQQDDYPAIAAGVDTLHARGGGVLFFPAGKYYSSQTLKVKSGVILRGDVIPAGQNDPMQASFVPPSMIEFPQYVFDTLANGGSGTDNSTAFKLISGEVGGSNMGVVDLDINRAVIKFQPDWVQVSGFSNRQPSGAIRNVVVMGVRSNNAALADPGVPATGQKPWQRFSWRFSTNIDVNVAANCIVAKCRLNDGLPKDNFMMEGFAIQQRNTTRMRLLTVAERPLFDYDAHYGISVNRKKTYLTPAGAWAIDGYALWASPAEEPTLFSPGIEVLDNWIYKTSRVAIIGAGNGLVMKGNKMYDDLAKPSRSDYMGPTGRVTPQGATTFENRGIDFSGWNIRIENNHIECTRNLAGGYLSTDGEGILLQECCGGTQVNDYVIKGNVMALGNYVGIYKMRTINNVNISDNDMGTGPIWVWANTNGTDYYLNGTYIANNRNVGGISLNGDIGGVNCLVTGNQGQGGSSMSVACHVEVAPDNQGYAATTYNNNGGQSCAPMTSFPQAIIVGQGTDSSFCASGSGGTTVPVLIKVTMRNGDPANASGSLMLNNVVVANSLTFDVNDSTARVLVDLPIGNGTYNFAATVLAGGNSTFTRVRTFTQNCAITSLAGKANATFSIYPNPAKDVLYIQNQVAMKGLVEASAYNLIGSRMLSKSWMLGGQTDNGAIDVSSLPQGVYMLKVSANGMQTSKRFVKQ